jgi:hypothetical protein
MPLYRFINDSSFGAWESNLHDLKVFFVNWHRDHENGELDNYLYQVAINNMVVHNFEKFNPCYTDCVLTRTKWFH